VAQNESYVALEELGAQDCSNRSDKYTSAQILASSRESVGDFWFGQISQRMK